MIDLLTDKNEGLATLVKSGINASRRAPLIFEIKAQEMYFGQKDCLCLTLSDITEMTVLAKLRAESKMKDMMAESFSKELLVPVNCMSSLVQTVMARQPSHTEDFKSLKIVQNSAEFLINHIKGRLDKSLLMLD